MAVPRNRVSNSHKRQRRAHHALKKKFVATCSNCGNYRLSHTICSSCGFYNQRQVVATTEEQS